MQIMMRLGKVVYRLSSHWGWPSGLSSWFPSNVPLSSATVSCTFFELQMRSSCCHTMKMPLCRHVWHIMGTSHIVSKGG